MKTQKDEVRFMYNGIKVGGKLYKAWFSKGVLIGETKESITVYARCLMDGLPAIGEIKNNTDSMTDYFETDRMVIREGDKYWEAVVAALAKLNEHNLKTRKAYDRATAVAV